VVVVLRFKPVGLPLVTRLLVIGLVIGYWLGFVGRLGGLVVREFGYWLTNWLCVGRYNRGRGGHFRLNTLS
jgi:hypothetical protein